MSEKHKSEKNESDNITDDHHMHLILQAQAVTNSNQTSLESTYQPSVESSSGFDLIQKEQELNEKQKISRQNRHNVNDNHKISYKRISNLNVFSEKVEENNSYKWEKEKWENCIVCFEARPVLYIAPILIHSCIIFHDEWFKIGVLKLFHSTTHIIIIYFKTHQNI